MYLYIYTHVYTYVCSFAHWVTENRLPMVAHRGIGGERSVAHCGFTALAVGDLVWVPGSRGDVRCPVLALPKNGGFGSHRATPSHPFEWDFPWFFSPITNPVPPWLWKPPNEEDDNSDKFWVSNFQSNITWSTRFWHLEDQVRHVKV